MTSRRLDGARTGLSARARADSCGFLSLQARELFAAFAAAEADKLIETKGAPVLLLS